MSRPLAEEQTDVLILQLAELINKHGVERFVSGPLLDQGSSLLPNGWQPNADGVGRLISRLMMFVGVETTPRVRIHDYTALATDDKWQTAELQFFAATPAGEIAFELSKIGEPDSLIGTSCHQVGAAWVALKQSGLHGSPYRRAIAEIREEDIPEGLGSIASIYLGLGIPAANAAYVARHGGENVGYYATTELQISSAGGLSIEAITFLLATQILIRNRPGESQQVRKGLRANQRGLFDTWLEVLLDRRADYSERLNLPKEEEWPNVAPPQHHEIDFDIKVVVEVDATDVAQFNRDRSVFRVRRRRTMAFGAVGGIVVGGLAVFCDIAFGLPGLATFLTFVGSGVVGSAGGWRSTFYECSDAECQSRVTPEDQHCPRCGGAVVGEIASADDRLDAEERLEND